MDRVARRRLALWPDDKTRAEAARLFTVEGWGLRRVLMEYNTPEHDEVVLVDPFDSQRIERGKARRVIYAAWSLIQEAVGEPDTDRNDAEAIERIVREHGVWGPIWAECHTGTGLSQYNQQRPDEDWWGSMAPPHWPDHAVDRAGALRDKAKIRSQVCPDCGYIHAGECP
jgi:hypothetical protein